MPNIRKLNVAVTAGCDTGNWEDFEELYNRCVVLAVDDQIRVPGEPAPAKKPGTHIYFMHRSEGRVMISIMFVNRNALAENRSRLRLTADSPAWLEGGKTGYVSIVDAHAALAAAAANYEALSSRPEKEQPRHVRDHIERGKRASMLLTALEARMTATQINLATMVHQITM